MIGVHQCGFRRNRLTADHKNSVFVRYLRKNGSTMKQCISCVQTLRKLNDSVRREVLYNILIAFRVPMKLVMLIKMCLKPTADSG